MVYHDRMNITSTAFDHEGKIPARYTCDGDDVNPPLVVSDVPSAAKTLALIVDDPDSPTGTWLHWSAWNIPAGVREITEGALPATAMEGTTTFDETGYGGPCPHQGEHRYFFRLYALDSELDLAPGALREALERAMEGHILAEATLMGRYKRT